LVVSGFLKIEPDLWHRDSFSHEAPVDLIWLLLEIGSQKNPFFIGYFGFFT